MVVKKGFVSERQRRAFFATGNFARSPMQPSGVIQATAFSYRDGRRLGQFKTIEDVFKKFPSERKAFDRVMKFRRKTGLQVNTIEDIKKAKRRMNNPPVNSSNQQKRWDR